MFSSNSATVAPDETSTFRCEAPAKSRSCPWNWAWIFTFFIRAIRVIRGSKLVSEVFETRRHAEVATTDELNGVLQFVSLFSGHANLLVLQLTLDFKVLRLDRENDLLRLVALQALLNFQFLAGVAH